MELKFISGFKYEKKIRFNGIYIGYVIQSFFLGKL